MAQRNARIDRFAQMNKQEELIAKKRQEILEKQRTAQLAKAVAAAQNLSAKLKSEIEAIGIATEEEKEKVTKREDETIDTHAKSSGLIGKHKSSIVGAKRAPAPVPVTEQAPSKVQNFFCNDGSFLDHFKKILEKHEPPKPPVVAEMQNSSEVASSAELDESDTIMEGSLQEESDNTSIISTVQQQQLGPQSQSQPQYSFEIHNMLPENPLQLAPHQHYLQQRPESPIIQAGPVTVSQQQLSQPPPMLPYAAIPPPGNRQPNPTYYTTLPQQQQQPPTSQLQPPQAPPPPPPVAVTAALPLITLHNIVNAPPPPPPPPQVQMPIANVTQLYMIPAPEPLQLNAIPAPKEFDLNAIPKPQLNLDAIKVPPVQQQMLDQQQQLQHQLCQHHQMQQQPQPQDNNDHSIQIPTTIESLIALVADYGDDYEDKICSRKNDLPSSMRFLFDKTSEQYHNYRQQLNEYICNNRSRQEQRQQNQEHQVYEEHQEQQQQQQQDQTQEQQQVQNEDEKDYEENINQESTLKSEEEISSKFHPNAMKTTTIDIGDIYDPESAISGDVDSDDEYMRGMMDRNRDNIKRRIECRKELSDEERQEEEERRKQERRKVRKSRWGDKIDLGEDSLNSSSPSGMSVGFAVPNQNKPRLTAVTRNDPQLLQYASLNYGSINLSEEDWRKCEEHYKVNLLYQDMMRKRQEIDRLARSGKFRYEYDSDEDVEGGTWEHKLRCAEMEATHAWAQALTKQSEGKHHIGDFLPPEELKKFMEQYEAKKSNRQPDLSDYKEYKLKEDNIGFQMLQKLGWKEGQALGTSGVGIVEPVNKAPQRDGNQGLGIVSAAVPENCDNEYDAYRKRMMLAYRFRPNPLNNPRRAYY